MPIFDLVIQRGRHHFAAREATSADRRFGTGQRHWPELGDWLPMRSDA